MLRLFSTVVALALLAPQLFSQAKEPSMASSHHAHGTFTVTMQPQTPSPADGLGRFSIDKQIHGDLEGTTKGEMISGGDAKQGLAGYVAMELFTGTLAGKHGSFALQHSATMHGADRKMNIQVVPGSGTGDLRGISGAFTITFPNGGHAYDFDYTLPN